MMIKLNIFARKMHRLCVMAAVLLMLLMGGTGLILKYPNFAFENFPWVNASLVRALHNSLSPYFAGVLGLMAFTGLLMYYIPGYLQRTRTSAAPSPPPQTVE
jgi:hypothetical protein